MASLFGNQCLNVHSDVLSATPSSEEEKQRLVEELKSRAKNSLKVRNYPEAIALYSKGIELLPGNAILFANRSMCHLSMGVGQEALNDASKAIELDGTYAKAYYRLASAQEFLKSYSAAIDTLKAGLRLVPEDKEMLAKLSSVEALVAAGGCATSTSTARSPTSTTLSSSSITGGAKEKATSVKESSKKGGSSAAPEDVEEDGSDLGNLRGYKKTADGRTTTYFNRELDENAKALIGSISPVKLVEAPVQAASATAVNGGSAWNSAGTYESKNVTKWAEERLRSLIEGTTAELPGTVSISVSKVVQVAGDAEIVMNRGKRKYLSDFQVDLEWSVCINGHASANGTMTIRDINAEKDYDIVVSITSGPSEAGADALGIITQHVKGISGSFRNKVLDNIGAFFDEFHAK